MVKGERKRRRQRLEEGAPFEEGSGESVATDATDTFRPASFHNDARAESSASEEATPSEEAPEAASNEAQATPEVEQAPIMPKPVALAEILAAPRTAPRPQSRRTPPRRSSPRPQPEPPSDTGTESSTLSSSLAPPTTEPAHDPFFTSPAERLDTEPQLPLEGEPRESAAPPPFLPPNVEHAAQATAPRQTNEPVLLALLLVVLLVLAFNTYFTLRLNGLSDRLGAMGSNAAATATPVATGERPWVGVDSVKTAAFASGGQPVTTVHIVNSGREPAYDLRSNTVGSLRSAATAAPDVPAQPGPLATTGLLLPNTGGNLTFFANTRALTAEEANNVRSGQYVLWLAGRLDYKDSKGHPHLTTFRYRYDPAVGSFIAAPNGNVAN